MKSYRDKVIQILEDVYDSCLKQNLLYEVMIAKSITQDECMFLKGKHAGIRDELIDIDYIIKELKEIEE
jgi:hypothetical protein